MDAIRFQLESGSYATFFLSQFVVLENNDGSIRIDDGIHGNGGWRLHKDYCYDEVMAAIIRAKREKNTNN